MNYCRLDFEAGFILAGDLNPCVFPVLDISVTLYLIAITPFLLNTIFQVTFFTFSFIVQSVIKSCLFCVSISILTIVSASRTTGRATSNKPMRLSLVCDFHVCASSSTLSCW